jgi:hypothetical protein
MGASKIIEKIGLRLFFKKNLRTKKIRIMRTLKIIEEIRLRLFS